MGLEDLQGRAERLEKMRENLELMETQLRSDVINEITSPMVIDGWRSKLGDILLKIGTHRKE